MQTFEEAVTDLLSGIRFATPKDRDKACTVVAKLVRIIAERHAHDRKSVDEARKSFRDTFENALANTFVQTADEEHLKLLCRLIGAGKTPEKP